VAHKSQVYRLPRDMSAEEGALIEPLSVALAGVLDNRPQKGDQVLVIGGGVIGMMVVMCLRALGPDCGVTVAEPSPFHAGLAKEAGADSVVTDGDMLGAGVEKTNARRYSPLIGKDLLMGGFSRIFDCVGNSYTVNAALRCLDTDGTLTLLGIGPGLKIDPTPLWLKTQTIKGTFAYGFVRHDGKRTHVFEIAIDLVRTGKAAVGPMMTHIFPLNEFAGMLETNLNKKQARAVKTAVKFA
jgi:threonine dehydrogenase-like Zn-dependent dehydrogenase